jgi:hypothetical protein
VPVLRSQEQRLPPFVYVDSRDGREWGMHHAGVGDTRAHLVPRGTMA